jgi:hypothetical protein
VVLSRVFPLLCTAACGWCGPGSFPFFVFYGFYFKLEGFALFYFFSIGYINDVIMFDYMSCI